jgi:hypothetical protein
MYITQNPWLCQNVGLRITQRIVQRAPTVRYYHSKHQEKITRNHHQGQITHDTHAQTSVSASYPGCQLKPIRAPGHLLLRQPIAARPQTTSCMRAHRGKCRKICARKCSRSEWSWCSTGLPHSASMGWYTLGVEAKLVRVCNDGNLAQIYPLSCWN